MSVMLHSNSADLFDNLTFHRASELHQKHQERRRYQLTATITYIRSRTVDKPRGSYTATKINSPELEGIIEGSGCHVLHP